MNFSSIQGNGVVDPPGDRDILPQYAGVSAKVCKGCGFMKTLSQYNRRPGTPDGYSGTCKECFGKAVKRGLAGKQALSADSAGEEPVAVEPPQAEASLFGAPVKKCTSCNITKSLDRFWHNKGNPDGYFNQCIECYNAKRGTGKGKKKSATDTVPTPAPGPGLPSASQCVHFWLVGEYSLEREWPDFYMTHERPSIHSDITHQKCKLCGEEQTFPETLKLSPQPKNRSNGHHPGEAVVMEQLELLEEVERAFATTNEAEEDESATETLAELYELEASMGTQNEVFATNGHVEESVPPVASEVATAPASGASDPAVSAEAGAKLLADAIFDGTDGESPMYRALAAHAENLNDEIRMLRAENSTLRHKVAEANGRVRVAEIDLEMFRLQTEREALVIRLLEMPV